MEKNIELKKNILKSCLAIILLVSMVDTLKEGRHAILSGGQNKYILENKNKKKKKDTHISRLICGVRCNARITPWHSTTGYYYHFYTHPFFFIPKFFIFFFRLVFHPYILWLPLQIHTHTHIFESRKDR